MNNFAADRRAFLIERIKNAGTFLDAVFFLHLAKLDLFDVAPSAITPQEVFGRFDEDDLADCLRRSEDLLSCSGAIGEAAFSYPGAVPYEQALQRMKEKHPGFSDDSYAAVVSKGMIAMR